MEIVKLQEALKVQFPELDTKVSEFINTYIDDIKEKKKELRNDGKLSFGKYKGFYPKELAETEAGRNYLTWLFSQEYFTQDKFGDLYDTLVELGIKKKKDSNAGASQKQQKYEKKLTTKSERS